MTENNADQTPTELLIEKLQADDIDEVKQCFILCRKESGAINYRTAGMDTAELLGFLRFAIENQGYGEVLS